MFVDTKEKANGVGLHFAAGLVTLLLSVFTLSAQAQVGHVLSGVGPVGESLAGAGSANALDPLDALYWNPATISQLPDNALGVSVQILSPTGELNSTVPQGAFGPMGPQQTMTGQSDSDAGPFFIPALGLAWHQNERLSFGISAFGVGGFGVDYALSNRNPIATPQPPNGMGFGAIFSEFSLMQIAPTAAYKLSDQWSVGISPVLNLSTLEVNPFPATNPDDANGDGYPGYPNGPRTSAWGFGFQAGLHFAADNGLNVGLSYKSTQHFEDLKFDSKDQSNNDRTFNFNLDYPMIITLGLGYTGMERWQFAADVRYIDFENTDGFNSAGFDQTGAVQGFGWESIFSVALGVQYQLTDRLPIRAGYSWNDNPVPDKYTFFNVSAPAIIQHHIGAGFSYQVSRVFKVNAATQIGLKNDIEGSWYNPQFGEVTPTRAQSSLSTLLFIGGVEIKI